MCKGKSVYSCFERWLPKGGWPVCPDQGILQTGIMAHIFWQSPPMGTKLLDQKWPKSLCKELTSKPSNLRLGRTPATLSQLSLVRFCELHLYGQYPTGESVRSQSGPLVVRIKVLWPSLSSKLHTTVWVCRCLHLLIWDSCEPYGTSWYLMRLVWMWICFIINSNYFIITSPLVCVYVAASITTMSTYVCT